MSWSTAAFAASEASNEVIEARVESNREACVSRAGVERGVRSRSPKVSFVPGSDAHVARIVVVPEERRSPRAGGEAALHVTLELERAGGETSRRELSVRSCDEALEASALIVALWLDPAARAEPEEELEPAPLPPAPPDEAEERPVVVEPPSESGGFAWTVGASAHLALGPAPLPLLGPALAVAGGSDAEQSGWAPWVRLLGTYGFQLGEVTASGGEAEFALVSVGMDACPVVLGGGGVRVRPCAHAIFGALGAEGRNTVDPRTETRPYAALGASLVGEGELGGGFEVVVSVGVDFPLVRDSFQFEPVVFHEVASRAGSASLGVAYRPR